MYSQCLYTLVAGVKARHDLILVVISSGRDWSYFDKITLDLSDRSFTLLIYLLHKLWAH